MCKGSQTTTSASQYTPNPQALGAYSNLISQAQGVAATPYVPYTGELVAPVNPQESTGIGGVNQYANFSLPSSLAGLNYAQAASQPITSGQIQQYESPFTQQVVNSTQQQFDLQNAQQQAQLTGNAIAQGALGGNRTGVAAANLANAQQTAQAPVIAGLENTGYQTGLNTALTEQQAQLMGAYGISGIGQAAQNALETGAGQQIGAGQLEQTTQQAQDTAAYQQYLNQLAYPFQTSQWLAGIEGSIGPQMGGSGTAQTTGPAPSLLSQIGGLGSLATGLGGSSGLLSSLSMLSDERVKENIKAIGRLNDGQIIYRFNYKGDPSTHIGLIAQQVERKHPEAVHKDDLGLRHVDYDKATRDAEGVAKRDMGGGMSGMEGYSSGYPMVGVAGGVQPASSAPYGHPGGSSYVPASQLSPAYPFSWRLPTPPSLPNQQPVDTKGVAALANGIFGNMNKKPGTGGVAPSNDTELPSDDSTYTPAPENNPLGPIYRRGGGVRSRQAGGEMGDVLDAPAAPAPQEPLALAPPPGPNGVAAPVPAPADNVPLPQPRPAAADAIVPLPQPRPSGLGAPIDLSSFSTSSPAASAYTAPEPRGDYSQNDITAWQHSVGGIESGNNYQKLGPITSKGDQALGRYGIMQSNLPSWSKQILGYPMSRQEFLNSPDAQDAIFRAKFGNYVNQYGLEGAARAWYAGEHGMNNLAATAHDANGKPIGVTVADYGARFLRGLGLAPPGNSDALPVNSQPTQGQSPFGGGGQQQQPQGVAGGQGFLQKLFPNVDFSPNSKLWPAMIAAGAGMLSSRSPFPGVAIGEGATAGLNEYQYEKQAEQAGGFKQTELQQNAQKLQREADQFALNYQLGLQRLETEQRKEAMDEMKPIQIGQGPMGPIYAVRDPKSGGYRVIDPETGQPSSQVIGGGASPPQQQQPSRNPIGGTAPGVTVIPNNANAPAGSQAAPPLGAAPPPSPGPQQPNAPQAGLQPAVYNSAAAIPPSVVDVGNGRYDDAASGVRSVYVADTTGTEGLNQDTLTKLKADPYFQKNPGDLSRAIQIAKGLAPIPPTSNRSYLNQFLVQKAYELNPDLNATTFPMRQRALNFFAVGTQGGGGQQFIAFNRWLGHAGRLESIAEQLGMGPNVSINTVKNMLSRSGWGQTLGLTDDQTQKLLGEFEVAAKGVAAEGAKVMAGVHPGERDREDWERVWSPDTPLSVMQSKIKELMNMGRDAMDANVGQYNMDMGTNHNFDQFLTNRTKTIMHAIDSGASLTDTIKQLDSGQQSSLRPADQQAVQWANSHPDDPRSAQIKQRLGIQ